MPNSGVYERCVADTPIAVVDFETTGLTPGGDRVVEVSVVRLEPNTAPQLILDTLVNPRRPVAATEIHGITDADVVDAPPFEDVAGDFVRAIAESVVASYNVYFDMRFMQHELAAAGLPCAPPHFCLMYLRPMLGFGKRCCLEEACRVHGVRYQTAHLAAADCEAAAGLMHCYLAELRSRGISTFADLADLKDYKFVRSFERIPVDAAIVADRPPCTHLKSRRQRAEPGPSLGTKQVEPKREDSRLALKSYWGALRTVVADLQVTDAEIEYLKDKKRQLGLADEQVRVLHARAFSSAISRFVDDEWLDDREAMCLHQLRQCLAQLGWAPGD